MKTLALLSCGLVLGTVPLPGQERLRASAYADGALVRFASDALGGVQSGATFMVEGGLSLGRVAVGAGYMEGRLQPGSGGAPEGRDLVEARVFFSGQPAPWLTLSVGPRVRSFVTDSSTVRWVLWQFRARAEGSLTSVPLKAYTELWRAVSARVNWPEPVDHVQGGEAGVVLLPPRSAVWVRLGYRVDGAHLGGSTATRRTETVEAVSLAVGFGGR